MKWIASFGIFWMLILSQATYAADVPCDGCSYGQMRAKALNVGKGSHRIYSISTGQIYGFSVTCSGDAPLGIPNTTESSAEEPQDIDADATIAAACPLGRPLVIADSAITNDVLTAWNLALDFYDTLDPKGSPGDTHVSTNDLPGHEPFLDSVYPMLSDNQARNDLYRRILANQNTIQGFAAALAAGALAHFNILPNQILIVVTFKDGTTVVLVYAAATRQLEQLMNTAQLPNGQSIIELNTEHYAGHYNVGGMNPQDYLNYLQQERHITVVVYHSGGPRMNCSWNPGKTTLTCYLNSQ